MVGLIVLNMERDQFQITKAGASHHPMPQPHFTVCTSLHSISSTFQHISEIVFASRPCFFVIIVASETDITGHPLRLNLSSKSYKNRSGNRKEE